VNVYLRLWLTGHLLLASCCWRLYLCRSQEWALHSPNPTGFVYLELSWMLAPFIFSSIQPYPPVAIAVLFCLEFTWSCAPPPLSSGACHTLVTVGCRLLSKPTGGSGATPAFSGQLVYLKFAWGIAPSPLFGAQGARPSLLRLFFFFQLLVYYSVFFLFSLGWGQFVQGAMLTCPRVFCGSTTCHLAHLVVCFSHAGKELGSGSAGALLVSLFNME
jgi:hypothetical protein